MKEDKTTLRHTCFPRSRPHTHSRSFVALTLCLVLGSFLLKGCLAAGMGVAAMTAVTTAGVFVSAVEHAVQFAHEQLSIVVQNETEVYTGPGEEYSKIGRVNRSVEVHLVASRGDWLKCSSALFEKGWIHRSRVAEM